LVSDNFPICPDGDSFVTLIPWLILSPLAQDPRMNGSAHQRKGIDGLAGLRDPVPMDAADQACAAFHKAAHPHPGRGSGGSLERTGRRPARFDGLLDGSPAHAASAYTGKAPSRIPRIHPLPHPSTILSETRRRPARAPVLSEEEDEEEEGGGGGGGRGGGADRIELEGR
jgi:hypothetical protein